jgi:fructuronate reductase
MELSRQGIKDLACWKDKGYEMPSFDIEKVAEQTRENPEWVHFGGGNIFRAFPAAVCQDLLNQGIMSTGIIIAEGYDYEIVENGFDKNDNLSILVTLNADGKLDKKVIGSITEALCMDRNNEKDWDRLREIFRKESLKMVSLTITEKGYSLCNNNQVYFKGVLADFENGPIQVSSYMGKLTGLCYERFINGEIPLTMVSMDNCTHNGEKLKKAVTEIAMMWYKNGKVPEEFIKYINNSMAFPCTMIDKITPRPADSVMEMLRRDEIAQLTPYITKKNTFIAPYVNAEKPQYLIIEDNFKTNKLPLDKGGIIYTQREIVDKVERMKVTTCLNPLHTALAIFGCLLSYEKISDEMNDILLKTLVERIGYQEGLVVVTNPGIIEPEAFLKEVLEVRLPNPFMPDTPGRIACDTSQKLSIRFGETIKAYEASKELKTKDLVYIPLVLAGWCRYLMGVNDGGVRFDINPDPMAEELKEVFSNISIGQTMDVSSVLEGVLNRVDIFGVDLYEVGLGKKIEEYFAEMIQGVHGVYNTLKKYID